MKCKVCKAEDKGRGTYCDLHLNFYFYKTSNPLEKIWKQFEKKKSTQSQVKPKAS